MAEQRDRWSSRTAFIMAAIGSAVGLGSIWRFPIYVFRHGGGAFLIPYIIALVTAGIPLLILEYSIGQYFQSSSGTAFKKIDKRLAWIGWWALSIGFLISVYYAAVMAWSAVYLFRSFSYPLPWAGNASGYFFDTVLSLSDDLTTISFANWPLVIALLLTWVSVYYIIKKGVTRVGKVVMVTVPLPVMLIVLLILFGMFREGAIAGINYYLTPDFSYLNPFTNPQIWLDAYGQIFFSLSIGFGIMITYASYLPKKTDITNNAIITALANCGTSFLGGFAVFSTLGFLAAAQGRFIGDVAAGGPKLAFIVYPSALELLPGIMGPLMSVLFFIMLLSLGIDSLFSLTEAISAGIEDKFSGNKQKLSLVLCVISFLLGLFFVSRQGLLWLDIFDHWLNNYGLVLVGLAQCLVIVFFFGTARMRAFINEVSEVRLGRWWDICIAGIVPGILLITVALSIRQELLQPYEGYPRWALVAGGWGISLAVIVLGILLSLIRTGKEKEQEKEQEQLSPV